MSTILLYKKLSKITSSLLSHGEFLDGGVKEVHASFIDGFYDVLKTAYEMDIKKDRLDLFVKYTRGKPTDLDALKFVAETVENPDAYRMINYYFALFIGMYVKCAKEDKLDQIYKIIKDGGIDPVQFDAIENDYKQMMLTKKLATKFAAA